MKSIIMLIIVATVIFGYSCKKQHECECTFKLDNKDTSIVFQYKEYKKETAKKACADMSDVSQICKLK